MVRDGLRTKTLCKLDNVTIITHGMLNISNLYSQTNKGPEANPFY